METVGDVHIRWVNQGVREQIFIDQVAAALREMAQAGERAQEQLAVLRCAAERSTPLRDC